MHGMAREPDARDAPVTVMMRYPALRAIPPTPTLAPPLALRRAHADDAAALTALLADAFPAEHWEAKATEHELFHDPTVRATFVIEDGERLIATASLQVRADAPWCGLVRWVATHASRRRQGLAQAVVVAVLTAAADAGCTEARLRTSTAPLTAVRLYLGLGFEPLVMSDAQGEVWQRVIGRITDLDRG